MQEVTAHRRRSSSGGGGCCCDDGVQAVATATACRWEVRGEEGWGRRDGAGAGALSSSHHVLHLRQLPRTEVERRLEMKHGAWR